MENKIQKRPITKMWAWPLGISHLGNSFSKVLVHETPIFHY